MRATESEPRFCPRCGAGAVAGMPFCPQCGFDLAGVPASGAAVAPAAVRAAEQARPAEPVTTAAVLAPPSRVEPLQPRAAERGRRGVPPVVLAGLLVMVGIIAYAI